MRQMEQNGLENGSVCDVETADVVKRKWAGFKRQGLFYGSTLTAIFFYFFWGELAFFSLPVRLLYYDLRFHRIT